MTLHQQLHKKVKIKLIYCKILVLCAWMFTPRPSATRTSYELCLVLS